jgi:NAD(P)-dependent dehydrogenase (short-subunit alcohol dehydrogenase family)
MQANDSRNTIALVTGANKGIGLETARQLGKKGVTVLIGARDRSAGEAAATTLTAEGIDAHAVMLDVTDSTSVRDAALDIEKTFGRLDILVNNAGIMKDAFDAAPSMQTMRVWRDTFDTNLFGMVETTQAMLPLLMASPAARIVNVSSVLGSMAANIDPESTFYHFKVPAYNVSRTAVNAWTVHLAYELRETPIKVNAAHPGFVKTDLHGVDAPMNAEEGAETSVWLALLPADGPHGMFFHGKDSLAW